jgi:hypothetical protein
LCEQVTVENVGEVRADIAGAAALWAAPWVVRAALELGQEVRLTGRLLVEVRDVVLDVVRDVFTVGAGAFVEVAAPAGGVAVDTGDIDVAGCSALEVVGPRKGALRICQYLSMVGFWGEKAYSVGRIVEYGDIDAGLSGRLF